MLHEHGNSCERTVVFQGSEESGGSKESIGELAVCNGDQKGEMETVEGVDGPGGSSTCISPRVLDSEWSQEAASMQATRSHAAGSQFTTPTPTPQIL